MYKRAESCTRPILKMDRGGLCLLEISAEGNLEELGAIDKTGLVDTKLRNIISLADKNGSDSIVAAAGKYKLLNACY